MINEIYIDDILIKTEFPKKQFKSGFTIRCNICKELIYRKWFDNLVLEKLYECKPCVCKTRNPMNDPVVIEKQLNSVNTDEYKTKMSMLFTGSKNPFYGKTHSKETMKKVTDGYLKWIDNLTDEEYSNWTQKCSIAQQEIRDKNPDYYKQIKQKAAFASCKSQYRYNKLNKVEQRVIDYLNKNTTKIFEYSVILDQYQFDFGCKEDKLLIEVDGDYWHGNPNLFNEDGSNNKRILNPTQKKKQLRDIEKTNFANIHNFKLIRLWESEILNGSFIDKLKEVL